MIKKILSPLVFAALFVLGTSPAAYSDSLPGSAAQPTGSQATCVSRNTANNALTANNTCNQQFQNVTVWLPLQSRTTGNFRYFATAPQPDQTACSILGKDFNNGVQFSSAPFNLNGNTQIGNSSYPSSFNTVVWFECVLKSNGRLQSVNSIQL